MSLSIALLIYFLGFCVSLVAHYKWSPKDMLIDNPELVWFLSLTWPLMAPGTIFLFFARKISNYLLKTFHGE
jgi:hypothetical protein